MSLLEKDKRKFSVIIGSKKCGACSGASPSGAARKVKGKSGAFYLKETTKGSKKKLYGPYSSKKKVVQRGGTLREELCKNLLHMFDICPSFKENRSDDGYKSIENAFRLLGISNIDPNRYTKLRRLILLRTQYEGIGSLCQLLCSEELPMLELYIEPEIDFIIDFKKNFPKDAGLYIEGFSPFNWMNFIKYFNHQLKNMEIRNNFCLNVLDVLNNCDSISHPAHFKDLLPNVYIRLILFNEKNNCNILKGILTLRERQTPSLLDVLFNINENLKIETLFIYNNFSEITKLKQYSSVNKLTQMWHTVIKDIREFINNRVKERIEGIEATRAISEAQLQSMLKNLEEKERKNQEILHKTMREYEEAKASSSGNNLQQLNNKSFLLSSQRNGKKPSIPSYLLMSTINNRQNRGFVRGGPAQQGLQNFEEHNPAQQGQQNSEEEAGPSQQGQQNSPIINNSKEDEPVFISPLLRITHTGRRTTGPANNRPPQNMLNPVGRRRNVKPNQPPHNSQNPQPPISTLEARLAALIND